MKKIKQINGYIIKEKNIDEIPVGINEDKAYAIFDKNKVWIEDNLTFEEALEWCKNNK